MYLHRWRAANIKSFILERQQWPYQKTQLVLAGLILEGIISDMLESLINDVDVVDINYISNLFLNTQQQFLVGAEEVRVSRPFLRLQQWLFVRAEEVRVSSPSLRPWQQLLVGARGVRVSNPSLKPWQQLMVGVEEVV